MFEMKWAGFRALAQLKNGTMPENGPNRPLACGLRYHWFPYAEYSAATS